MHAQTTSNPHGATIGSTLGYSQLSVWRVRGLRPHSDSPCKCLPSQTATTTGTAWFSAALPIDEVWQGSMLENLSSYSACPIGLIHKAAIDL